MAQIDLRHADIYIKDGFTNSGAVNQPGGYPIGTTVIVVDGFLASLPDSGTFKITGDTTTYTIASTVGGATPTSITFTPGLVKPVADNAVVTYSLTGGLVNNAGGYPTTTTAIVVDGLSEAIPDGSTLKFSGHATIYTISGTVGGATPTEIDLVSGLTATVADDEAITIFLVGAVNKPGTTTPLSGDTSITVDGFSKAIPNGNKLTIVGSSNTYTVVSTTGGSTPTVITFTPAFATADGLPIDNAVVSIGSHVLKVKVGEGNLTFEEKRNMIYVRDKRSIADGFVMTGDDEPMDVSLDIIWEFLSSDTSDPPTIEEALKQEGNAASWITSGADPCEPYAVDIEIIYTPPCSGIKSERIVLTEYRWESIPHDLKAGTMSTKGKCKILSPVITRETSPLVA